MTVINMTPHDVHVVNDNGTVVKTYVRSGQSIRLETQFVETGEVDGVPIMQLQYTKEVQLPESQPDTIYIVSQLVKSAFPSRKDFFFPAEVVRDEKGNIVGCKALAYTKND